MIQVRNLEGVAGTVQVVVKEYHCSEAKEHHTAHMLYRALYELHYAEGAVAMIHLARAMQASSNPLAAHWTGQSRDFSSGRRMEATGLGLRVRSYE